MSAELKEVIDRGKRALGELCMPVSQDELPSEIRGQPGVYVFLRSTWQRFVCRAGSGANLKNSARGGNARHGGTDLGTGTFQGPSF